MAMTAPNILRLYFLGRKNDHNVRVCVRVNDRGDGGFVKKSGFFFCDVLNLPNHEPGRNAFLCAGREEKGAWFKIDILRNKVEVKKKSPLPFNKADRFLGGREGHADGTVFV